MKDSPSYSIDRLTLIRFLLVVATVLPTEAFSLSTSPPFQLQHIDHVVLNYRDDMAPMFDFYTKVLGCTVDSPDDIGRLNGKLTHLRAGPNTMIDLMEQDSSEKIEGTPVDHFCLRIDPYDQEKLEAYLKGLGIEIESSGMRKGAQGVGPSTYIRDPEGNMIELKGPSNNPVDDAMDHREGRIASSISTADPPNTASVPLTPCTRICRYNSDFFDGQVCIGCYREAFEIGTWESMTPSEKHMALQDAIDRWNDNNSSPSSLELSGSISLADLKDQADYWQRMSS